MINNNYISSNQNNSTFYQDFIQNQSFVQCEKGESMEGYKLIDLTTFNGREGQLVYVAIVYFYGKGHNDLLRIVVSQNTYEELQSYLNQDVSTLITLNYNSFKKSYTPSISIK